MNVQANSWLENFNFVQPGNKIITIDIFKKMFTQFVKIHI